MLYKCNGTLSPFMYVAMNFCVNLLLILLYCRALWAAPSSPLNEEEPRIVGGATAKPHSHPYLVSLQYRLLWIRFHMCGGALLNKNWVLSAGHCIDQPWYLRWIPIDLIAGTDDVDNFGPTAQIVGIGKQISHPLYAGGIGPYDLAMLRAQTPFVITNEVQPINLPTESHLRMQMLTLAGWGVLRSNAFIPDLPTKLQEVEVTYLPYDECFKALEEITEDDEENPLDEEAHICTGPLTGGIAACSGDSGGPLIQYISPTYQENKEERPANNDINGKLNEGDNDYLYNDLNDEVNENNKIVNYNVIDEKIPVVVGIVSWGISPCGAKGAPTVYTNVSSYMNFIYRHLYD